MIHALPVVHTSAMCFTLTPCEKDIIHHQENVPSASHPNKKQSNEASLCAVIPTLLYKG